MIVPLEYRGQINIITGQIPNFENLQQQLVDCIDASPDVQQNKTNLKTKMTDWRLHKFEKSFIELANFLKQEVAHYQKHKHKSTHELTVTECWGAHYQKDGEAFEHSHYPALWSGIAYIKLKGTCMPTVFPECDYKCEAKVGKYIIFPGWLKHYVEPGSDDRYICAFNIRALQLI